MVPRTTVGQKLDTLSSQLTIMGYRGIVEAFAEFPKFSKQMMTAFGKAEPTKVFVIGTAVAGL